MKSKLVILSLMLAGIATIATAQTKSRYYAESAKDNYFISVGVGGQMIVNPNASDNSITPAFNISVGKLINPVWGVRGMVSGFNQKLYTAYNLENAQELKKNTVTLRAEGLLNLSSAFAGYNPDRKFEAYAFMLCSWLKLRLVRMTE